MFIPDTKDSADHDESMEQQLPTQLSSSITTDLTNLSSQQTQQLNSSSSSSDHPSDQTSRLGDELETDKSYLSAAYLLDQPPKLVSRSSSFYAQNLHGHSDIQMTNMLQTIQQSMQPLQPLLEHRPSIDTIDSYVESKLVGPNFIEHQKLGLDPALLDSSNNALLNSFSFDSSTRLSSSSSYNGQHPYFEQFEPAGLLDQQMAAGQTGRCGPTVVLIAHHEDASNQSMCPSMCANQQGISLYNYHSDPHNHPATSYHLNPDNYPHPPPNLIDSNQIHHH